ncbi:MAG TPA: hypothetical protein VMT24_04735 [Aggregatilineaceae bacterium]|nr:hypothetical protein [Aggregatilineaceae bacterium]
MKTKMIAVLVVTVLVLGGYHAASAVPLPAIVSFESSLATITVVDAEAGATTTTLTWHAVGVTPDYRLALTEYLLDRWEPVFPAESVPLEADDSREVTVHQPLNFGPPTYLLSIIAVSSNDIVDQRILTIPYDTASLKEPPAVDTFTADVESLDAAQLAAGQAQVTVTWAVSNRLPTSNLVFEQVFDDGTSVSVELPRPYLWVPSTAHGPVAPVYRAGEESAVLRLQVVDQLSGEIYAEEMLDLPITGTPPVFTPTPPPQPQPTPQPQPSGDIVSFTANPNVVNPGAAVTLAWEVRGTLGVIVEERVPNMTAVNTVVNVQSPKGSAEVFLPDYAAYSVSFTLWTSDRRASADAVVLVHCPFAFFFGQGDGCPSGKDIELGASYQAFENGFMIWRSDTSEIYAFYNDHTASYFLAQDYASLPEPTLTVQPPLDRQAPGSGFGKVWANAPGVRQKLGWALSGEEGYNTRLQGVAATRQPRPAFAFYLTLPDGSVIGSGYGVWQTVP